MANINWAKVNLSKPDKVNAKKYGISTQRFYELKHKHFGNWDNKTNRVIQKGFFKGYKIHNRHLDKFASQIDWHRMTNIEIATLANCHQSSVFTYRKLHNLPPSPLSQEHKEQRKLMWKCMDWKNLRNNEIMKRFKIPNPIHVSNMRKRYAPETVRKQKKQWKSFIATVEIGKPFTIDDMKTIQALRQAGNFCMPPRTIVSKKNEDVWECVVINKE